MGKQKLKEKQKRILITIQPDEGIRVSELQEFIDILLEMKNTAETEYVNDDVSIVILSETDYNNIQETHTTEE